jgi:hypothetical protein
VRASLIVGGTKVVEILDGFSSYHCISYGDLEAWGAHSDAGLEEKLIGEFVNCIVNDV